VYKNFKIRKIIDHSDMFQIVCDPLSGSIELYLAEIRSGSLTFVMFGSIILNQWCVCVRACVRACALRRSQTIVPYTHITGSKTTLPNTDQAHDKYQWTPMNFSQVQLHTPWWWLAYDPKHIRVIF